MVDPIMSGRNIYLKKINIGQERLSEEVVA